IKAIISEDKKEKEKEKETDEKETEVIEAKIAE
ncbi:hypothetical protein LCGC14_3128390, partial [marine sediment metagenome]